MVASVRASGRPIGARTRPGYRPPGGAVVVVSAEGLT
jgi:hypothetical protein